MEFNVTQRGLEISGASREVARAIRTELTVAPLPTPSAPRPLRFAVYSEPLPNAFVVPYFWGRDAFPRAAFRDDRPPPDAIAVTFKGELKEPLEQPEAARSTLHSLRTVGGAVLSLPTGHGKTAVALHVACSLGVKTLILVHKSFLADQWAERIAQFVPRATVSKVQGAACNTSGDFVIAMVQTLMTRTVTGLHTCGLLVFDEAHHAPAKVFATSLVHCKYMLGLSATPTRKDGLERLMHATLGPMAFRRERSEQTHVTVKVLTYACEAYKQKAPSNARGTLDFAAVMNSLVSDKDRTRRIADVVCSLGAQRNVLVLSHRRAHCQDLVAAIPGAALYLGGSKLQTPTERIIVATYSLVSEGFDVPRLDTLVLATPASDVEQTVGRILRGATLHQKPLIIDVVDAWSVCFAQAAKRRKTYAASGFAVRTYAAAPPPPPPVQPLQKSTPRFVPDDD